MTISRRELCVGFPAALLPLLGAESQSSAQNTLASAMYPFDKLPVES
jgi:hypothetical protein